MAAFEFTALDSRGREQRGTREGDTAKLIRQQLRDEGLIPLAVEPLRETTRRRGSLLRLRRGIGSMDLALITRQLGTLLASGLPLEEALQATARQSEKAHIGKLLSALRSRLMEGHSLASALADYPQVFPELYRATVAAGEQSGHLEQVFERLADYTERRHEMKQKVGLALFYPAILTLMAIAVVIGLLTYVVPQVVEVFASTGQTLPDLTRALIASSDFFRDHGILLLILLLLAGTAFRLSLRRPATRTLWHRLLLRLPLVGRLVRGMNTARFARTLSILASSGVTILDALKISAEVVTNRPMRHAVEQATDKIRQGRSIYQALEESGEFPPMALQLIASGEASGNLDAMLGRAADHQEKELETSISALLGVFEPVLILVMGGVVMVIVLAILLPIFEMNQLVG